MSLASVTEQHISKLGGEAKVKLADLHQIFAELEAKVHTAAVIAEPQVKAALEAAIMLAGTALEKIIISEL